MPRRYKLSVHRGSRTAQMPVAPARPSQCCGSSGSGWASSWWRVVRVRRQAHVRARSQLTASGICFRPARERTPLWRYPARSAHPELTAIVLQQALGYLEEPRSGGDEGTCISTCSRPVILRCPSTEYFVPVSSLRGAWFGRTIAARAIRSRFFEAPFGHFSGQRGHVPCSRWRCSHFNYRALARPHSHRHRPPGLAEESEHVRCSVLHCRKS